MRLFVDSSVWFSATVARDRQNARAKDVLGRSPAHVTTDHVIIETWLLLNSRYDRHAAESFWGGIRKGGVQVEFATAADFAAAWRIGEIFPDQDFSIVDRTSFAVMERLGLNYAASFDDDFAVYRYGPKRDRAFEVLR